MKSAWVLACVLALLATPPCLGQEAGAMAGAMAGSTAGAKYTASNLNANNQVPTPVNSPATGSFSMAIGMSGSDASWMLQVADVTDMNMAHLHLGNATTNGPVVVYLVPPGSAAAGGPLPTIPPVSGSQSFNGTFTAADMGGPLAGKSLADLQAEIQKDNIYANVHTVQYPAGVIRAQLAMA